MTDQIPTVPELFPGVEDVTADPSTDAGREQLLAAAVRDGRLVEASLARWRSEFKRDPARAAATLSGLASPLAPDVGSDRLFPGQA